MAYLDAESTIFRGKKVKPKLSISIIKKFAEAIIKDFAEAIIMN